MGSRNARTTWLVMGGLVALVLLAFGTMFGVGAVAHKTERAHTAFPGPVRSVDVGASGGSVHVVGTAGSEATVDAVINRGIQRPSNSERLEGDRLVIRGGSCMPFFTTFCGVDYTIHVPHDLGLTAHSSGGDITVSDLHGTMDLSSSGGRVGLQSVTSDRVRVESNGGEVTASGLTGTSVDASSNGGEVSLSFAGPPTRVDASSSGGGVLIELPDTPDAYRVEASSSGGGTSIRIRTDPASSRLIRASSSGGDVTIRYHGG